MTAAVTRKRSLEGTVECKVAKVSKGDVKDAAASFDLSTIKLREEGDKGTLEYRVFFDTPEGPISPWHKIPLYTSDDSSDCNMIVEIPKWTRAKFEISTKESNNPIKQDEKKGVLRDYKWGDMCFNYGAFPQTWEDPSDVSEDTGHKGDDDPLDVIEVGARQLKTGEVVPVKVLGVLAMIDDGETDWKVLVIRKDDLLADKINDVDDLEVELPGAVGAIREWLRVYKLPEGKPENSFGLEEKAMPKEYAMKVIAETHELWAKKYKS
ncbi:hypothetical protein CYMTET_30987 [Cymbomonas tetramitiformis]|uniref:inorganic diphosphatase n=1 Tax=Cymbomonas tetramitiformis TaxID=36881 RepID=A0AAE0KTC2_9CHLO|nr:hypothetical protein CYMTET_30987 [Cymbomonas tetramitiformis]